METGDYYRPHGCNSCSYKFAEKAKLIRHLNSVHISKRIKCQWCDWTTKRGDKLVEHSREKHNQKVGLRATCDINNNEQKKYWPPSLMHIDFDTVDNQKSFLLNNVII